MFYYFLVELLTWYDTRKFHALALPDSEKPGLFRVNSYEQEIYLHAIECEDSCHKITI